MAIVSSLGNSNNQNKNSQNFNDYYNKELDSHANMMVLGDNCQLIEDTDITSMLGLSVMTVKHWTQYPL